MKIQSVPASSNINSPQIKPQDKKDDQKIADALNKLTKLAETNKENGGLTFDQFQSSVKEIKTKFGTEKPQSQVQSEEEVESMKEAFQEIDINGNGKVSRKEINEALKLFRELKGEEMQANSFAGFQQSNNTQRISDTSSVRGSVMA